MSGADRPTEELEVASVRMRRYGTRFWSELSEWLHREARFADVGAGSDPAAHAVAHAYLNGGE